MRIELSPILLDWPILLAILSFFNGVFHLGIPSHLIVIHFCDERAKADARAMRGAPGENPTVGGVVCEQRILLTGSDIFNNGPKSHEYETVGKDDALRSRFAMELKRMLTYY